MARNKTRQDKTKDKTKTGWEAKTKTRQDKTRQDRTRQDRNKTGEQDRTRADIRDKNKMGGAR
jgi:hypothetical protein